MQSLIETRASGLFTDLFLDRARLVNEASLEGKGLL